MQDFCRPQGLCRILLLRWPMRELSALLKDLAIVIDGFGILWFHAAQDREFLRTRYCDWQVWDSLIPRYSRWRVFSELFCPSLLIAEGSKSLGSLLEPKMITPRGLIFQNDIQTRFKSTYCTLACILDWLFSSQVAIKHYQGHRHLSSRMPRWPQLRRCDNVTRSWNGLEPKSQKPSCHQRQRSFGHKADQHSGGVRAPKVHIVKV